MFRKLDTALTSLEAEQAKEKLKNVSKGGQITTIPHLVFSVISP